MYPLGLAFSTLAVSAKWAFFVEILLLALLLPVRQAAENADGVRAALLAGK